MLNFDFHADMSTINDEIVVVIIMLLFLLLFLLSREASNWMILAVSPTIYAIGEKEAGKNSGLRRDSKP